MASQFTDFAFNVVHATESEDRTLHCMQIFLSCQCRAQLSTCNLHTHTRVGQDKPTWKMKMKMKTQEDEVEEGRELCRMPRETWMT